VNETKPSAWAAETSGFNIKAIFEQHLPKALSWLQNCLTILQKLLNKAMFFATEA
jgi:hypothetical protein